MSITSHNFSSYHLHFYYDESNITYAKELGKKVEDSFKVELGRFHEKPVGPHPMWSVQLTLEKNNFFEVLSFCIHNRRDLIFFIHPVSGNDLKDHTDHATWVGEAQELKTSIFQ